MKRSVRWSTVLPSLALLSSACRTWCIVLISLAIAWEGYGFTLPRLWGDQLADAQVPEVGNDVLAALEHTDEFIRGGQWNDAVETLVRIMENQSEVLIRRPVAARWQEEGFAAYITLREYCQIELASWHSRAPEALEVYRRHVDTLAARWYEEAIAARSESQLQRIVDELLLSTAGDQALLRLGEMALQRGNYTLARWSWERISPQLRVTPAAARLLDVPPGTSWWFALRQRPLDSLWSGLRDSARQPVDKLTWLAYPDSAIPLAEARIRLMLVSLLEGNRPRAALEWELLRQFDPEATGELAGRRGNLADMAAELLHDADRWPSPFESTDWTTLGGCPARNRVLPHTVDVARRPIWRTALPVCGDDQDQLSAGRRRSAERREGLLSYHVAASDGIVYIVQADAIRAIDVATGKPAWPLYPGSRSPADTSYGAVYQWPTGREEPVPLRTSHAGVPRYVPTVDDSRLITRLGHAWTGGGGEPLLRKDQRSHLVGIDLSTQKLLFDRIAPAEPGWEFESAPLASQSHLFVSLRRRDPASAQCRVACYSMETGRLVWQRDIVRAEGIDGVLFEISNSALALRDDMLFYNTNLGVVVALRASDGRLGWMCQYRRWAPNAPGVEGDDRHWFRDPTPCLVDGGLVLAAPADSDRILAIDAAAGQIVWTTAADVVADAVHLLGVGQGHVLASGDHLYWINVVSGQLDYQFPAPRHPRQGFSASSPRGYGRGVLAGDAVYWPTYDKIYVFRQGSNQQIRQPVELGTMGLTGGNLVLHRGTLLIAAAGELVALNESGHWVTAEAPASTDAP